VQLDQRRPLRSDGWVSHGKELASLSTNEFGRRVVRTFMGFENRHYYHH
jgi:hypothetical protein